MTPLPDFPPVPALDHFAPHARGLTWRRASGGFSGASVWRGDAEAPRVALKAWPPGTPVERVLRIHAWLARAAHLPFVPAVLPGAGGRTVFADGERVWDCCRWMPGAPRTGPTAGEVALACDAAARLHGAWAAEAEAGPCPAVRNRLRALAECEPLLVAGPGALPRVSPLLDPLLRRAVAAVTRAAPAVARALRPWAERTLVLRPCVRDLRAEHVLFDAGRVSGLVDYGAAAVDHPAGDLARLLADFGEEFFEVGLTAYRARRADFDAPDEFVSALARTGPACSVLGWLVRLALRRESVVAPGAIAGRLGALVTRVEHFAPV